MSESSHCTKKTNLNFNTALGKEALEKFGKVWTSIEIFGKVWKSLVFFGNGRKTKLFQTFRHPSELVPAAMKARCKTVFLL